MGVIAAEREDWTTASGCTHSKRRRPITSEPATKHSQRNSFPCLFLKFLIKYCLPIKYKISDNQLVRFTNSVAFCVISALFSSFKDVSFPFGTTRLPCHTFGSIRLMRSKKIDRIRDALDWSTETLDRSLKI